MGDYRKERESVDRLLVRLEEVAGLLRVQAAALRTLLWDEEGGGPLVAKRNELARIVRVLEERASALYALEVEVKREMPEDNSAEALRREFF